MANKRIHKHAFGGRDLRVIHEPMNIGQLTQRESMLEARMPRSGSFEQLDKYLKDEGLYGEWQDVFNEYAKLALNGNLEALKRAVFFIWYRLSEPFEFHGIRDLDQDLCERVLRLLNVMCANDELDAELKWMLPYCYNVCDYYFDRFSVGFRSMLQASKADSDLWRQGIHESSFADRGQLGQYWSSLNV